MGHEGTTDFDKCFATRGAASFARNLGVQPHFGERRRKLATSIGHGIHRANVVRMEAMHISISRKTLAAHVLRTLALAQREGEKLTLDILTLRLDVRRSDVRTTLSALHREGHVDVLRTRLTLTGYALGTALLEVSPRALRRPTQRAAAAA